MVGPWTDLVIDGEPVRLVERSEAMRAAFEKLRPHLQPPGSEAAFRNVEVPFGIEYWLNHDGPPDPMFVHETFWAD
jgi:hypothetical protein